MKAVTLLSGGLDSSTTLGIALAQGYQVEAINIHYGQRHQVEIEAARKVAKHYGIKFHEIVLCHPHLQFTGQDGKEKIGEYLPGVTWGGSALLNDGEVPTGRDEKAMGQDIPITYVPARNTFLIGIAASLAEAIGAEAIFVGFNVLDYSGYPDCRPEYVAAYNNVLRIGTKAGHTNKPIVVQAPIVMLSKAEVIKKALELKVPLELTWSCYNGGKVPCGVCDSCILRNKGFAELGMTDPSLK